MMRHTPVAARKMICASLALLLTTPALQANDWPLANPERPAPMDRRQSFLPVRNAPDFAAPSAADCRARPALRELVGAPQGHQRLHGGAAKPGAEVMESKRERPPSAATPFASAAPAPEHAPAAKRGAAQMDAATAPQAAPQPAPQSLAPASRIAPEPVTAGVVDDNAAFAEYQTFRQRTNVRHEPLDIRTRRLVEVKDSRGTGVADAELRVTAPSGQSMWARTDAAGRAWIHPDALDGASAWSYQITARTANGETSVIAQRGDKSAIELRVGDAQTRTERARLDLVFVIDATGSMADEIAKLKTSLHQIAADVSRLPARPDVCFAYVAYRDHNDEFVWRAQDFTGDLAFFQRSLAELQASGGGDYPEAMSEALHEAVHNLSWRGGRDLSVQRMAIVLADAPPQLGSDRPSYAQATQAALGKGIKFYSVAASGLDKQGEFIQRQIAQYTGGKFVFLTYAQAHRPDSGPGRETVHDVQNYSVNTLDKLVVRLITDELAPLGQASRFGWR